MICQKCGHKNDKDAQFCEKCGTNFNTILSQSNKIAIIGVVFLVIVIGITAGVIIKNSQQTSLDHGLTNASMNQITNSSGFTVSQASNLAVQITNYNGNFKSLNYGSLTLDNNQVLYILAKAIVMINSGEQGNIAVKSIKSPVSPYGTVSTANIAKSDYVNIASRTYTWIDNNGRTPNYVGITNPGQPDLSPISTLNLFSKVLSQYNSTGQLPESVSIP